MNLKIASFITPFLFSSLLQPLMGLSLRPASAQSATTNQVSYSFFGQQVPLTVRTDVVGVAFHETQVTSRGLSPDLQYLQLERELNSGGTRSLGDKIEVQPLGSRFAVVTTPIGGARGTSGFTAQLQKKSYVEETVPVLAIQGGSDTILMPNEMLVTVDSNLSQDQVNQVMQQQNLEVIRPLRFTQNRYLVRSTSVQGLGILNLSQQLSQTPGIRSASPNFVEAVSYNVGQSLTAPVPINSQEKADSYLSKQLAEIQTKPDSLPFNSKYMPLLWHLDSRGRQDEPGVRTDIRAPEAWQISNGGKNVKVAVIDSLIQWDHPDLAQSLLTVGNVENKLPGEKHGWDFAENDPDTRISNRELRAVVPRFQDLFRLTDAALLSKYSLLAKRIKKSNPHYTDAQVSQLIRYIERSDIASEFHGTWSAGVITARPSNLNGVIGVAPNAKLLPVRVFGLEGEITTHALVEALYYSAARDVDVINLSLGSSLPNSPVVEAVFEILDQNPDLVIVASAGNSQMDGVGFPAGIPGVISVGATNLQGERSPYSNYGGRLDVVAPGGDTSQSRMGGILTTGGTFPDEFWNGLTPPKTLWGPAMDPRGKYVSVQGTSFSGPAVSGVVALMKGADPNRHLSRDRMIELLKQTASHQGLEVSRNDTFQYRLQSSLGFANFGSARMIRPSGIFPFPQPISPRQYYFGVGLVNAAAAVKAVKRAH